MVLWEAVLPHHPKGFGDSSAISHLSALFLRHFNIMKTPDLKSFCSDSLKVKATWESFKNGV